MNQWTSFCIVVSSKKSFYRTFINGAQVYEELNYRGSHRRDSSNLMLLNHRGGREQAAGAVTDLNVWSRALGVEESRGWAECELEQEGDIIAWSNISVRLTGYREAVIARAEVCRQASQDSYKEYIPFETLKRYQDTKKFCHKVGGRMAVSTEDGATEKMVKAARQLDLSKCRPDYGKEIGWFFSGHSDTKQNGRWVEAHSGQSVELDWDAGYPKDSLFFDCGMISVESKKYQDHTCDWKLCPMCEFTEAHLRFHLAGVCKESSVDRYYVTTDHFNLVGFLHTNLVWSARDNRWEITDGETNNTLAFYNQSNTFPLGVAPWYFTENCTDPHRAWRSLSLHLDVEQPGMFCCDDGACIPSSLVCDDFYDCEDRSDETNCTIMTFQEEPFNKNKPPVLFKDGKKNPLPVNASIRIYKVFDINESESSFDIFFKLMLEWNDKNLREIFQKRKICIS